MKVFAESITIAIPVYERYDFFEECLESAIGQTVKCKILVVDNCSTNNRFKETIDKIGKSDIAYHRNESNLGMVGNWNKCLELVDTEWITILHDDDLLYANYIECFEKVRQGIVNAVCIASSWEWATLPNIEKLHHKGNVEKIKVRNFDSAEFAYNILSPFPGIAFKSKIVNNKFDNFWYPISDFDFWYRISKEGLVVRFNNVQAYYRLDAAQTSSDVIEQILKKSYVYRKDIIKPTSYLSRLFFLATTINSVRVGNRRYNKTIDAFDFLYKEDWYFAKFLSFKLILYASYILKYLLYRFPKYLSFHKI